MNNMRIIVAATNDLATDQRLSRHCSALYEYGYEIILRGRILRESLPVERRPYRTMRVKHLFRRGPLFYAEYNIKLFFFLLFKRFDIVNSNDLDTLPACYLASRLKRKPLVYDSHEYFTGVPELNGRPVVKKIWETIEKLILPKIEHFITVSRSIASVYSERYGSNIDVVRNLPVPVYNIPAAKRQNFSLPDSMKMVIMQGAGINTDRGAEEAVMCMHHTGNTILVIAGKGDAIPGLRKLVKAEGLEKKVFFIATMPRERLMQLTSLCDCGLSIDKDSNLNYRYSLPNKLFDYIMAGIPVVVSDLPEPRRIVEQYGVGMVAGCLSPKGLSEKINEVLAAPPGKWKGKLEKAAKELNWDREKHKLLAVYQRIGTER